MTEQGRAVIEYLFKDHEPPDMFDAFGLPATLTFAPAEVRLPARGGNILSEIRAALEEAGYEMHGAVIIKRRNLQRYLPKWREVWTEVKQ